MNLKYISLKLLIEEYETDNLKNLGINFNNIKKLEIHFLKEHDYVYNKNYSKNILSFFKFLKYAERTTERRMENG